MKSIGYDSYTSWFVTIGCTTIYCLSATPYRLAGLIFVLIIENYDTDRKTASIPILLFLLIRCLGGPLFGVLGEKFGWESVTIFGCVLTAVGFGTCFYTYNVIGVILLLGVVYGVGIACSSIFIPSIMKKHFKKHFNSANGISNAGPCFGAFVIPAAAIFLIDLYGVSGAFLIWSGIMLNAIPIGMYIHRAGVVQDILIKHQSSRDKGPRNEDEVTSKAEEQFNIVTHPKVEKLSENPVNAKYLNREIQKVTPVSLSAMPQNDEKSTDAFEIKAGLIAKNEVCSVLPYSINEENKTISKETNNGVAETFSLEKKSKEKQKKKVYGFKVFTDISFLLLILTIGLATYVSTIFWTTTIDYSRDKGISRNLEIYFLMVQPLVDLIGRACFGWLTDLGYLTFKNLALICYAQMAISMFFIMWTKLFWVMLTGACCFVLASGVMNSAYSGMIFECVEKEHQTMAISARHSVYGALVFTSSPLIGYFRENLGSYDGLYCLFIVLCIICALLVPLMFKFSKKSEKK